MAGHEFVGHGEAASEEAAQGIAATRFVQYLVKDGLVEPHDLPCALEEVDLGPPDNGIPPVGSESTSGHVTYKPLPPPHMPSSNNPSGPGPPRPLVAPSHFSSGTNPSRAPPPHLATPSYFRSSQPGPSAPPPPIQPPPKPLNLPQTPGVCYLSLCVSLCICTFVSLHVCVCLFVYICVCVCAHFVCYIFEGL